MTTRFLYITDTHWGARPNEGYAVQPRDPSKADALYQGLRQWLAQQDPPIDFVLHGGDVINDGTPEQIIDATQKLTALGTRVMVCLGNHDLQQAGSMANWRKHHQGLLPDESGSFAVTFPDCHLYVLNHHWHSIDPPHFWDQSKPQSPVLDDKQRSDFEAFAVNADRPIVLAIHAPVQGVVLTQEGKQVELHPPDPAWRQYILSAIDRFDAIKLVLTAHAHINTLGHEKQCVIAGTSAFSETPYEAKLVALDGKQITIQTLVFGDILKVAGDYRPEKAYAQGNDAQRNLSWAVSQ